MFRWFVFYFWCRRTLAIDRGQYVYFGAFGFDFRRLSTSGRNSV